VLTCAFIALYRPPSLPVTIVDCTIASPVFLLVTLLLPFFWFMGFLLYVAVIVPSVRGQKVSRYRRSFYKYHSFYRSYIAVCA
jgi:hypothetical protein